MSGHSKWSQIKRKKGLADKKKGQLFSKLSRMITVAALSGDDPATNFKLKLAIDKARAANMPSDSIERAIKRGGGKLKKTRMKEVTYEAYGPGGAALMIETVSDNQKRTLAELRHILSQHGGHIGETGSVRWMFKSYGVVRISLVPGLDREKVELQAIEAGAEDIREEDNSLVIYISPKKLTSFKESLEKEGVKIASVDVELVTTNPIRIEKPAEMVKIEELMSALDEHEDVSEIYSNVEN